MSGQEGDRVDESLFNKSNFDERAKGNASTTYTARDRMGGFYERRHAPNLGFIE